MFVPQIIQFNPLFKMWKKFALRLPFNVENLSVL